MKKRDKQRYDSEFGVDSELTADMAAGESEAFFDEQAAALLAAEFFAEQEDEAEPRTAVVDEVLPPEPMAAAESEELLAVGEISAALTDMEQAFDSGAGEAVGHDDGEVSLAVGDLPRGDGGGEARQEVNPLGVQERGYALAEDEVLPEAGESGDELSDDAADLSVEVAGADDGGSAEVDYNAIADRVYDMLLRQIRAELAGSGSVTE